VLKSNASALINPTDPDAAALLPTPPDTSSNPVPVILVATSLIDPPEPPPPGGVDTELPGPPLPPLPLPPLALIVAEKAPKFIVPELAMRIAPPPPPPPIVVAPIKPVRVGGAIQEPRIVKLVQPVYPALAARARVTGMVVLEAVVTEAGTVDEIKVISGHPLLVEAAIACVRQWLYEPTLLNGVPVPVILTAKVSFNFKTTF